MSIDVSVEMPPPQFAVLLDRVQLFRVANPSLWMAPPYDSATLFRREQLVSVRDGELLKMPPPIPLVVANAASPPLMVRSDTLVDPEKTARILKEVGEAGSRLRVNPPP